MPGNGARKLPYRSAPVKGLLIQRLRMPVPNGLLNDSTSGARICYMPVVSVVPAWRHHDKTHGGICLLS